MTFFSLSWKRNSQNYLKLTVLKWPFEVNAFHHWLTVLRLVVLILLVFVHVFIQINISGVYILSSFTCQLSSSHGASQSVCPGLLLFKFQLLGNCVFLVLCEFLCLGPCTVFVRGTEPCSIVCLEKWCFFICYSFLCSFNFSSLLLKAVVKGPWMVLWLSTI